VVLDDLIGSEAFKLSRKSPVVSWLLRNRHCATNFFIMAQNLRSVQKAIRLNCSLYVVFRYGNRKVITENLYEEVSGWLTLEQFEAVYDYATSESPHDALVIDTSGGLPENRLRKNFDQRIMLESNNKNTKSKNDDDGDKQRQGDKAAVRDK
jgi:hypothetical protein